MSWFKATFAEQHAWKLHPYRSMGIHARNTMPCHVGRGPSFLYNPAGKVENPKAFDTAKSFSTRRHHVFRVHTLADWKSMFLVNLHLAQRDVSASTNVSFA